MNRVNVIKFFLLEVLISYVLEPAWELITSRSTHRRVVRGERVPLSSIAHSRTFPCAIASGRITTVIAVVLSLLVLGGSFASEYAVDAVRELIELPDTALVNTLQDGRRADPATINSSKETSIKISTVATFIADRCRYFDEETNSYRVNASFTNATTEEKACVNNNPNMPYQVSDLCILSKNAAHDFCCIWDGENSFDKSQSVPEVNWIAEVQHENHSVITHTCDFRNVRETLLLACKNALILLACIAGNSLTIFDTVCMLALDGLCYQDLTWTLPNTVLQVQRCLCIGTCAKMCVLSNPFHISTSEYLTTSAPTSKWNRHIELLAFPVIVKVSLYNSCLKDLAAMLISVVFVTSERMRSKFSLTST